MYCRPGDVVENVKSDCPVRLVSYLEETRVKGAWPTYLREEDRTLELQQASR